jgi:hypothetical protein
VGCLFRSDALAGFLARSSLTWCVVAEVATLAHGKDVVLVVAGGAALAEVGDGEADGPFGEAGFGVVAFDAAMGVVQPALALALALFAGADVADVAREGGPVGAVGNHVAGHQRLT